MKQLKEFEAELTNTKQVRKLQKQYKAKKHQKQVTRVALILFDLLKKKHRMKNKIKIYLYAGSMLHDIGKEQGASKHHKSSQTMIMDELNNFTEDEKLIIGNIARYHRSGRDPKSSHKKYKKLGNKGKQIVNVLSGILSVADGIAKGKVGGIDNIIKRKNLIIIETIWSKKWKNLIRTRLDRKKDYLNSLLGLNLKYRIK